MRAGRARRRCLQSSPHPSLSCSSCSPFAFPRPLESLARIMCPRNEDQKSPSRDRHSPPPVLPRPAAACQGWFGLFREGRLGRAAQKSQLPPAQSSHCSFCHRAAGTFHTAQTWLLPSTVAYISLKFTWIRGQRGQAAIDTLSFLSCAKRSCRQPAHATSFSNAITHPLPASMPTVGSSGDPGGWFHWYYYEFIINIITLAFEIGVILSYRQI